ncbi:sel1 repeat family protein [Desulfosarcina sp.]|nr:sel1 repeat family protein [Desulfosarcina sp.]
MRFVCVLVVLAVLIAIPQATAGSLEEAGTAFEERDYKRAFQLYIPLAEQGVSEAMVRVAKMYAGSCGIKYNPSEALRWNQSAARQGNTAGAFGAARLFHEGRGTDQDYEAAADLYQQAAETGHAAAAAWLGELYFQGRGVDKDLEQAVAWFRVGAEGGNGRARAWLTHMKRSGRLAPNGTVVNKPAAPVVKVNGGVRQTITAVHPEPSPVQEKTSEAWWITFSGLGILLIAVGAFFSPKAFMYGRRSWFWRELIGEQATAIMIRVISFPVGAVGILLMIAGVIIIMRG